MTINIFVEISYRKIKIFIISSIERNQHTEDLSAKGARETRGRSTAWNHTKGVLRSLSTSGK